MAHGARLGAVVIFVQNLSRSLTFYQDVLALEVTDSNATAALLTSAEGAQLILRAMGANAAHPLGATGAQYVVWTTDSEETLDRCERVLRDHSAHTETRHSGAVIAVEGRDPDGMAVMIMYTGPDDALMSEIPLRIYAW
jgi:catechol-2,3-dioxygenase